MNEPIGNTKQLPVAWLYKDSFGDVVSIHKDFVPFDAVPLYTHPMRELTDEEYEKIMKQWDYWRKQIADGDTSSTPRDWFEGVIDDLLDRGEK